MQNTEAKSKKLKQEKKMQSKRKSNIVIQDTTKHKQQEHLETKTQTNEHLERISKNQKLKWETEIEWNIQPQNTRIAGKTVIFIRNRKKQAQRNKKQT